MAKEQFTYPETAALFKTLETISHRSGVSRARAFEDTLRAIVPSLAAETMEREYLDAIADHTKGVEGKRGVDLMAKFFGQLVDATSRSEKDVLGDLFQSAISYGENGLFLTSEEIARLMGTMTIDPDERPDDGRPLLIGDPCCGTGRMLLAASDVNPHAELVGVDVDARCARITAINLGLRSKYGWVVCGNSLSGQMQFAYRIGHFYHEGQNGRRRGVIRGVPPEQAPVTVIAGQMQRNSGDLFTEQDETTTTAEPTAALVLPTIMEVPQWLARLEPTLAALECDEPPAKKISSDVSTTEIADSPSDNDPPAQQTLF